MSSQGSGRLTEVSDMGRQGETSSGRPKSAHVVAVQSLGDALPDGQWEHARLMDKPNTVGM